MTGRYKDGFVAGLLGAPIFNVVIWGSFVGWYRNKRDTVRS